MSKPICAFGTTCIALILCGIAARAQNIGGGAGGARSGLKEPHSPLASWTSAAESTPNSGQLTTDERPLSGVQELTLGNYEGGHSFVIPSISVRTQLDTNQPVSGYAGANSVSYLLGRLSLHHVSGRSELLLDYIGGGMVSMDSNNVNSVVQGLEFSDSFKWQRWSLLLGDDVSYLSESPFRFGGVGGLGTWGAISQLGPSGTLGASSQSLTSSVTPSQTIPTAIVPRLSNTAVLQVEYGLSPRSSWTAAGSYGILRFNDPGYVNNSNALFQTGYNYQVSPLNSVGVLYRFNGFGFSNSGQRIGDQVVQLAYARRITGLLSFELAAGPDLVLFRAPLIGSTTDLSWSAYTSLKYQLARTALSVSYNHLLTAGSGVLAGALTNQVQGTFERSLSQTLQGSVSFGYAHDRALMQTTPNPVETSVNYYAGVQVSHQLRPGVAFFLSYNADLRGTPIAACATPACGSNFLVHELSVGFNWSLLPAAFR